MAALSATPQRIAADFGLDPKLLERPCEEAILPSLADFVHPWQPTFDFLISSLDIEDIDKENKTEHSKRVAALRKWKKRCGTDATYSALMTALLRCRNVNNAENLCRHLLETIREEQGS